jgi:transcriptional regulator with XRE-family HTH domain
MARLSAICGNTATVNSGLFLAYSNFMDYKGFAGRLKALQIECDAPKTQYKFAEWLGLSKSFVSELLRGEKLPSMDLAIILSDKFDVNIDWLMRGKGLKRATDKQQSSPLLDKFNQLGPDQQQIIELMVDQLSNKPKNSENNPNKPLTPDRKMWGGGGG